jgi:hypothetical protein
MDQPHGIVEAGRGRRLECHAADLDRDRPDLGDLTEGRGRIGGVEKALQEFNPRHATGDLRRHKPELAMRIWIVHVSLSLATGKAAVARQRGSRETVSGTIKLAGGLDLADLGWRSLYADRGGLRHLALRILVTGAASLGVAQLSLRRRGIGRPPQQTPPEIENASHARNPERG